MAVVNVLGQTGGDSHIKTGSVSATNTSTIVISGVTFKPKFVILSAAAATSDGSYIGIFAGFPDGAYIKPGGWTVPYGSSGSTVTYDSSAQTLTVTAGSGSFKTTFNYVLGD